MRRFNYNKQHASTVFRIAPTKYSGVVAAELVGTLRRRSKT